ncbi:MAG: PAS domain S-box protein [Elusimicrobiales bacterium]|nr:PAS domain S-box protein [Elusimicrobiales bacterium]
MARHKLLVAASSEAIKNSVRQALERAGYFVAACVSSPEDAVAAGAERPELAVLDTALGGGPALAAAAAEEMLKRYSVPAVFFSASAQDLVSQDTLRTRSYGSVCNPARQADIVGLVRFALYRGEMENALVENRRWLSATLMSIADAVIAVDKDGVIKLLNGVAENLIGRPQGECVGKFVGDVVELADEKSGMRVPNPVFSAMEQREAVRSPQDIYLGAPGGRRIFVGCRAAPITRESGEVDGAVLVLWDVTSAKNAQEAIQRSEEKYRTLVESANSIILRMDLTGKITFFNEFAQEFFGYAEKDIVGKNFFDTVFARASKAGGAAAQMLGRLSDGPENSLSYESENIRRGGVPVWISWTNRVMRLGGNRREILCVGNDITSLRQAANALKESERKYRKLFGDFLDAIYIADRSGALIEANRAYLELFGYAAAPGAGMHLRDIFEGAADLSAFLAEVKRKSAVRNYELRLKKKNGELIDCIMTSSLRLDAAGRPAGFEGVLRDITSQKCAQQELERSRQELELRVQERTRDLARANEQLGSAYSELQEAHNQLIQSEKLAALGRFSSGIAHEIKNPLGIIMGGIEYLQIKDLVPAEFSQGEFSAPRAPAALAAGLAADGFLKSPPANDAQALAALNTLIGDTGFYDAWLGRNKSAQLGREAAELVRATEDLRKMDEDSLMPAELNAVRFLNRYLLEFSYPAQAPRSPNFDAFLTLIKIKDATTRADVIVRNLLKFARPSELKTARVSPRELIEYAINNIPMEEKNHVAFETSYEDGLFIDVDRNQITQVIINVLVNAAQAIPKRREGRVKIRARRAQPPGIARKPFCAIEISDNGEGIKKEDLPRIFEPFYTTKIYNKSVESRRSPDEPEPDAPGKTVRRFWQDIRHGQAQGTGLGLSVSKSIINNHRGEMTLSSVEGEGTTVTITLPLADSAAPRTDAKSGHDAGRI